MVEQAQGARRLLVVIIFRMGMIRAGDMVVVHRVMERRVKAGTPREGAHQQNQTDQQQRNQPTQKRGPARLAERSVLQSDCKMSATDRGCKSRVKFCGMKFRDPTAAPIRPMRGANRRQPTATDRQ